MWIKRRRRTAPPVLAAANLFWLAGARVRAIEHAPRWQRWRWIASASCTATVSKRGRKACAVAAEVMRLGFPLAHELDAGRLTPVQAAAAGRELRRAHEARCAAFGGAWSHGDPHTGNFVYDPDEGPCAADRLRSHAPTTLSADDRQTDDLLIFLQDVIGRIDPQQWLPVASAFLDGYDRAEIIARLPAQLVLPRGLPRLWWAIRTSYLPTPEIERRLDSLSAAIASRDAFAAA